MKTICACVRVRGVCGWVGLAIALYHLLYPDQGQGDGKLFSSSSEESGVR